jgi:hypothetical protein
MDEEDQIVLGKHYDEIKEIATIGKWSCVGFCILAIVITTIVLLL